MTKTTLAKHPTAFRNHWGTQNALPDNLYTSLPTHLQDETCTGWTSASHCEPLPDEVCTYQTYNSIFLAFEHLPVFLTLLWNENCTCQASNSLLKKIVLDKPLPDSLSICRTKTSLAEPLPVFPGLWGKKTALTKPQQVFWTLCVMKTALAQTNHSFRTSKPIPVFLNLCKKIKLLVPNIYQFFPKPLWNGKCTWWTSGSPCESCNIKTALPKVSTAFPSIWWTQYALAEHLPFFSTHYYTRTILAKCLTALLGLCGEWQLHLTNIYQPSWAFVGQKPHLLNLHQFSQATAGQ